jgi:hypothetical protein
MLPRHVVRHAGDCRANLAISPNYKTMRASSKLVSCPWIIVLAGALRNRDDNV